MMRECDDGDMRDLLPDFVHGTLPARERERVAAHVGACAACAREAEVIRSVRAAFAAVAPAVSVPRIVAAIPAAPRKAQSGASRNGGGQGTIWRIAAAFGLVALGGLSVVLLRGVFSSPGAPGAATAPVIAATPVPRADSAPAAHAVKAAPSSQQVASQSREDGVSFGGGFSDLTDEQLETLLREVDGMKATPSAEPEEHPAPIAVPVPIVPQQDGAHNAR